MSTEPPGREEKGHRLVLQIIQNHLKDTLYGAEPTGQSNLALDMMRPSRLSAYGNEDSPFSPRPCHLSSRTSTVRRGSGDQSSKMFIWTSGRSSTSYRHDERRYVASTLRQASTGLLVQHFRCANYIFWGPKVVNVPSQNNWSFIIMALLVTGNDRRENSILWRFLSPITSCAVTNG